LHDSHGVISDDIRNLMDETLIFNLIAPAILQNSENYLQMYYIGPKELPYFRSTPYTDMAQTFDKLYPGHNENNFWDFFFPGIMEDWKRWKVIPNTQPVTSTDVTLTSPYIDALTGEHIISFFQPLWNKERTAPEGIVGIDITLEHVKKIIGDMTLIESGLALLVESNGNVLAKTDDKQCILDITSSTSNQNLGVTEVSNQLDPELFQHINNFDDSKDTLKSITIKNKKYLLFSMNLKNMNVWQEKSSIHKDEWKLIYFIPQNGLYSSLQQVKDELANIKKEFKIEIAFILFFVNILVLLGTLFFTQKLISGLHVLSSAANKISNNDYSTRVEFSSNDELEHLGKTFNKMVETISSNEAHLQQIVKEKTLELEQSNKELKQLASVDSLTQILNRRSFFEYAEKLLLISKRQKQSFTIVMCDLDHFKTINDTWGHAVGDEVLKKFSNQVSLLLRQSDVFARIGGEEFAIILVNTDKKGSMRQAQRITKAIENLAINVDNKIISITVSIGVACAQEEDKTAHQVLKKADIATYQAKENGRNQVVFYSLLNKPKNFNSNYNV
jgi:diguanylate cyclase (GGDEF)-like protein